MSAMTPQEMFQELVRRFESTFEGIRGGVPLDRMLPKYYKLRGWDQNGVPTDTTLKQLSIRR